jgi:hypothetical protein
LNRWSRQRLEPTRHPRPTLQLDTTLRAPPRRRRPAPSRSLREHRLPVPGVELARPLSMTGPAQGAVPARLAPVESPLAQRTTRTPQPSSNRICGRAESASSTSSPPVPTTLPAPRCSTCSSRCRRSARSTRTTYSPSPASARPRPSARSPGGSAHALSSCSADSSGLAEIVPVGRVQPVPEHVSSVPGPDGHAS